MAFRTIVHKEDSLLQTTFTGFVSMEELRLQMGEYVALALEHRCSRWLVDLSGAVIESVSLPDLLNHPDKFRKATEPLRAAHMAVSRALVLAEHQAELKFLETVSYNRGQLLRVFNSVDSALQWLKEGQGSVAVNQAPAPGRTNP